MDRGWYWLKCVLQVDCIERIKRNTEYFNWKNNIWDILLKAVMMSFVHFWALTPCSRPGLYCAFRLRHWFVSRRKTNVYLHPTAPTLLVTLIFTCNGRLTHRFAQIPQVLSKVLKGRIGSIFRTENLQILWTLRWKYCHR